MTRSVHTLRRVGDTTPVSEVKVGAYTVRCEVRPRPGGGTIVDLELPIADSSPAADR